jgi:beta-glucanase (GH16 family)
MALLSERRRSSSPVAAERLEVRRMLASVTRLVLVDAMHAQDIEPLTNGIVLDLATLPSRQLTVRADTSSDANSVRFDFDGQANYHTENYRPFAVAGDDSHGGYYAWTLSLGRHTLTATAYTRRWAQGKHGSNLAISFSLVDSAVATTGSGTSATGTTGAEDPGPDPGPGTNPPPVIPTPTPINTAPTPPALWGNWALIFDDEFNADGAPSSSTWTQTLWGMKDWSGLADVADPTAVTTAGGVLSITARQQQLSGSNYVSGIVDTGGVPGKTPPSFSFTYGYVEARIAIAPGNGLWSAFWMLPTSNPDGSFHDEDGELDIMEAIGSEPTVTNGHSHRNGGTWGHDRDTGVDLTQGFHTYALDWEPDHLTWYLDGQALFTVTDPAAIPTVAEYLILSLAVGTAGSWPGAPDATTNFPASMQVDWVRVWQSQLQPPPSIVLGPPSDLGDAVAW